ncbi:protein MKS1-like [Panicum miliaceum]|uniref:Protein MKS1-like n=1 Tax=Panicum miliaceum TaxID=4540 RepID=A0A3L6RF50_PANMI|nr:protein MKS1-like [Panicum miliaceum]
MEQYSSSSATTSSSSSPSSSQRGGGARELQGARPAPLRVRRDSHKIRKPPTQQQVREPVIIYAVSPKVVHADPSEFMSVVQRLTGARRSTHTAASSSSSPSVVPPAPHHIISQMPFFGVGHHAPSSSAPMMLPPPLAPHFPFQLQEEQAAAGGAHEMTSPAARLAAIEQASSSRSSGPLPPFPSILQSPGPLPPIQPSFFSPPAGAGPGNNLLGINLFGELISPAAAFLGAASSGSISTGAGAIGQNQQEASPSAGAYDYWGDLFNNQQHHHHQNQ